MTATTNQVRPSTNPSGGRTETAYHIRATERAERAREQGGLPEGTSPWELVDTLDRLCPHDHWTPALVRTLKHLMRPIPDADWREGRPVNFRRMTELADELGVTERGLRGQLNELLRLGAVAFEDTPNYHRGRKSGKSYGVDLAPSILLLAEARVRVDELAERRRRRQQLRDAAGRVRRQIRNYLLDPATSEALGRHVATIRAELTRVAPGRLDRLVVDNLEGLVKRLTRLLERCRELLDAARTTAAEGVNNPVDKTLIPRPPVNDRFRQTGALLPPLNTNTTNPVPPNGCSAQRQGQNGEQGRPTLAQLVEALPPNMALDLPAERRIAGTVTAEDLIDVCRRHRARLEVALHAWARAESTIGAFESAIVLIIAAARSAPDWPEDKRVHTPGGFFTALADRVAKGRADLRSSIHGIVARHLSPGREGAR